MHGSLQNEGITGCQFSLQDILRQGTGVDSGGALKEKGCAKLGRLRRLLVVPCQCRLWQASVDVGRCKFNGLLEKLQGCFQAFRVGPVVEAAECQERHMILWLQFGSSA